MTTSCQGVAGRDQGVAGRDQGVTGAGRPGDGTGVTRLADVPSGRAAERSSSTAPTRLP